MIQKNRTHHHLPEYSRAEWLTLAVALGNSEPRELAMRLRDLQPDCADELALDFYPPDSDPLRPGSTLYLDLHDLTAAGYLEATDSGDGTWRYHLTPAGMTLASWLAGCVSMAALEVLSAHDAPSAA